MSCREWNCCRTCMNTRALIPIIQEGASNLHFLDILNQTTGLKVSIDDNLPQQICRLCIDTVKKFDSFRKSCLAIHTKLESLRQERNGSGSGNICDDDIVQCNNEDSNCSSNKSEIPIIQMKKKNNHNTLDHIEFESTIEDLLKSRKQFTFENLKPFSKSLDADRIKCYPTKREQVTNNELHTKIEKIIKREQDNEHILIKDALKERSKKPIEINVKIESLPMDEQSNYECKVCQKNYTSLISYERHIKLHTLVKDVICEHCGKAFYFKNKLLKHCRSKHGYKKILKCSYCDFLGANSTTVKIHERLHTGERPYVCEVCSASFHRQSTYLQHRPIHLAEKTVQCDVCPARFKSSTLMRIHKNRSHRPRQYKFNCRLCTATYERRHDCVRHLRRMHRFADAPSIDANLERIKLSDLRDD